MKIVLLIRALSIGGAERQVVTLAEGLAGKGHTVTIMTFYEGQGLADEARAKGLSVLALDKRGRWESVGFLLRYRGALLSLRPDAILGYIDSGNLLGLAGRLFLPHLKVVWGIRTTVLEWNANNSLARALVRLEGALSRRPDAIIVNSRSGKRHAVMRGYPAEKLHVVPNGVDPRFFGHDREIGQRFRQELGVSEGQILVGMVGRLHPVKGHEVFLEAARAMVALDARFRFVVVGGGSDSYREHLMSLSKGLEGKVIWCGDRRDLPEVYCGLDFLSSCSHNEGLSNVLLEAMACGTPCVATDVGDSALILGDLGEVVPPRDPVALTAAWRRLDQSVTREWREACSRRVFELFSVARLTDQTEVLVKSLLTRDDSAYASVHATGKVS